MLYTYIKKHYSEGDLIFTKDIQIEGMNRANLCQQFKTLADNGKLMRCERGIYYLPKRSRFRSNISPAPETVAEYKYISRDGKISGYYSGSTFANMIGISLQVPMKKEIVSNNTAAIVKEVSIGSQKFIVRRTNVSINNENVCVLQLLELLKNLNEYMDGDLNSIRRKVADFAIANHITKDDIDRYIRKFPDTVFRYYYEMRLYNVLT